MANRHDVTVTLSDGRVLTGRWHPSFANRPALMGRCVDLSKAFKQVAIDCDSLMRGVLGYKVKDVEWRLFMTHSLPFGASASVIVAYLDSQVWSAGIGILRRLSLFRIITASESYDKVS